MKVYIGADHRGFEFKKRITQLLTRQGYTVVDVGAHEPSQTCDYPPIAQKVATKVAKSRHDRGILVCMSGIGQAIAANKVPGAYAALCNNAELAELSRRHNNANILVLGAKFIKRGELKRILDIWLNTPFEGGRHLRRVNQIKKMEKGIKKSHGQKIC